MKIADLLESQKIKQHPGPKCWTGWHKAGIKLEGGVRVNNCVKNESVEGCVDENFTDNIITQVHETWSRKYKRSINCSHPRGFSQKAHCAARKKRQAGGKTRSKRVTEDSANIIVENMLHKLVNSGMTEVEALGWIDDRLILNENLRKWFQQKWVRFGPDGKIRGACARGSNLEGKPKCLPQSKAHSLGKKGRATAARRKRREDSNPNRTGPARNVSTKESMTCPHCGGEMVEESQINEKTDACYYKVKSRYKVWPSAYASGALVQCRKRGAKNWGKSKAEESVAKNFADSKAKITLYTDPNYFGAEVDDEAGVGKPVVNLPLKDLVGFEPDVKMQDPKSAANMTKMVELIKGGKGHELPPILARRYKGGYQVLDGHHRFHAYQAAGAKTIPAKLIPDDEIQVISSVDQTSPMTETLKKVKGRWALVSRKDPSKVLQYYHGSGHPSKEWVSKVERRVHSFSENLADVGVGSITEIFNIGPLNDVHLATGIKRFYNDVKKYVNDKQAKKITPLNIDIPTEVYDLGDQIVVFVIDQEGPLFYIELKKFLDGFKSSLVGSELRARGKKLGFKIYTGVSDTYGKPIYSDTQQTDDSKIRIWQKLQQTYPDRIVGYDQKTGENLSLTHTDKGPSVRGNQPIYTSMHKKYQGATPRPNMQARTRLLKFLPAISETLSDGQDHPSKVLQYYHGSGHPSKEWVSKVERRVHSFSENLADDFKQGVAEGLDQDLPSVLYHATYKPRLKSIKLKGLGAGGKRNWEDSQRGVVYLALDPNVAESYAETSDMVPEEWLDQIVILKISTAGLDPNKFGIDSNVQDNSGDTVEYHGVIPVSNISLYKQGVAEGLSTDIRENFADGKGPGRPGDSQRHGIPKNATRAQLTKAAKSKGRKGQLARWQINMRRGHHKESIAESLSIIDNRDGWGNVPDNTNVEYLGLRVRMRPSVFLQLAAHLSRAQATSLPAIRDHLRDGGKIAAPFLVIAIPDEWEDGDLTPPARIVSHEGRNRMMAVQELWGDQPIDVHLFFSGFRARHLQAHPEWIRRLEAGVCPQGTTLELPFSEPWFELTRTLEEARPAGVKTYQTTWRGARAEYDPEFFDVEPDELKDDEGKVIASKERLRPRANFQGELPTQPNPDLVYRGMSNAEYETILRTGEIRSRGDYNFAVQKGLTYFSTDPQAAVSYAHSFAPWQHRANWYNPAWVIAIPRPDPSRVRKVAGTGEHEVGIEGAIPASEIQEVYRGRVVEYRPGESGRESPSAWLHWERIPTPSTKLQEVFAPDAPLPPDVTIVPNGEDEYEKSWIISHGPDKKWLLSLTDFQPDNNEPWLWDVAFSSIDQRKNAFGVTGGGSAPQIFAAVGYILYQQAKKDPDIQGYIFTAKEPSRAKLYNALSSKLSQALHWVYDPDLGEILDDWADKAVFTIVSPAKYREVMAESCDPED